MQNIFSGAESYIDKRIADTEVSTEPFEHCIVDNVFPEDLFESMHEYWPSNDVMMPISESGRTTGYEERDVMLFREDFLCKLSHRQIEFWTSLRLTICGFAVIKRLVGKFASVVMPRVGHLGPDVPIESELLVISDRDSYAIGPHTDTNRRLISVLFYLSKDPEYASYGTGLYQPLDPHTKFRHDGHYGFEHFKLHSRVDYKPNRCVAFPRSDRSFHGVEPVPIANCDRRLLIVNIRAPEGAV
jgi:hypothetical protein